MDWSKGQTVVAICDAAIYTPNNKLVRQVLWVGDIYTIENIDPACCMDLFDIGKTCKPHPYKLTFDCLYCDRRYTYTDGIIWFPEYWFRPLKGRESKARKWIRKFKYRFKKIKQEKFIQERVRKSRKVPVRKPEKEPV